MFGPECRCLVVVGTQWGDEGKGKIVDVLAARADLVIRYQGGANAGHTVIRDGQTVILHQIPTGILHPGPTCGIGNGVVLDPETFVQELEELDAQGVATDGRLVISDRAHLVLRYHKVLERAAERRQQIGTTGRGIGPAYEDKFGRRGVRVADLRDIDRMAAQVRRQVERANAWLAFVGAEERIDAEEQIDVLRRVAPAIVARAADLSRVAHEVLRAGRTVLLEGAQGALLDVDQGTYPFVTSSNTTAGGATVGSGIGPTAVDAVLGVMKAYTTRVGNGPFPTEADAAASENLRRLGGEFGATTGRPRRCGWFDAVVARHAARVNGLTALAVTKLDVLDSIPEIPVSVGYRLDGNVLDEFPADAGRLERLEPVYDVLEGWMRPIGEVRTLTELPGAARRYLDRLEALLEVPIRYVSVGDRHDQIVEVG